MSPRRPFQIRSALVSDLAPCARLFAEGQQEIEPRVPPWSAREFQEHVEGEEILVASAGSAVAGFLSFWRPDGFVHFLFVEPGWRRQGVGRALLAAARSETGSPLELKCLTSNAPARAFYHELGWRTAARGFDPKAPYLRLRQAD